MQSLDVTPPPDIEEGEGEREGELEGELEEEDRAEEIEGTGEEQVAPRVSLDI